MKNRLTMINIFVFFPMAIIAMNLPKDITRDLKSAKFFSLLDIEMVYKAQRYTDGPLINACCCNIMSALDEIKSENYKVGRISNQDMKKIEDNFYLKLQKKSTKIAMEQITDKIERHVAHSITFTIDKHKFLCNDVIKLDGADCARDQDFLKTFARDQITDRMHLLDYKLQTAQFKQRVIICGEQENLQRALQAVKKKDDQEK